MLWAECGRMDGRLAKRGYYGVTVSTCAGASLVGVGSCELLPSWVEGLPDGRGVVVGRPGKPTQQSSAHSSTG